MEIITCCVRIACDSRNRYVYLANKLLLLLFSIKWLAGWLTDWLEGERGCGFPQCKWWERAPWLLRQIYVNSRVSWSVFLHRQFLFTSAFGMSFGLVVRGFLCVCFFFFSPPLSFLFFCIQFVSIRFAHSVWLKHATAARQYIQSFSFIFFFHFLCVCPCDSWTYFFSSGSVTKCDVTKYFFPMRRTLWRKRRQVLAVFRFCGTHFFHLALALDVACGATRIAWMNGKNERIDGMEETGTVWGAEVETESKMWTQTMQIVGQQCTPRPLADGVASANAIERQPPSLVYNMRRQTEISIATQTENEINMNLTLGWNFFFVSPFLFLPFHNLLSVLQFNAGFFWIFPLPLFYLALSVARPSARFSLALFAVAVARAAK